MDTDSKALREALRRLARAAEVVCDEAMDLEGTGGFSQSVSTQAIRRLREVLPMGEPMPAFNMALERDRAIVLANKVLDRISADPDDNLAILARQFLRALEASPAGSGASEPSECCAHSLKGFICTLERGHSGNHEAHGEVGHIYESWPQPQPPTAVPSERLKKIAKDKSDILVRRFFELSDQTPAALHIWAEAIILDAIETAVRAEAERSKP